MVKQHGNMAWFAYLIPWEMNMVCLHDSVGYDHGSVACLNKQHDSKAWFACMVP